MDPLQPIVVIGVVINISLGEHLPHKKQAQDQLEVVTLLLDYRCGTIAAVPMLHLSYA